MSSIQARRRGLRAAVEVVGWYWPELGLTAGLTTVGVIKADRDQPVVQAQASRTDLPGPAAIEAGGAEQ